MLTEEDLIEALWEKKIRMSKRVLTDWRRRHYLPRLRAKGLGRGQGKIYFWAEQDILGRASLIDELLKEGFTGTKINMVIWLLGYEVPLYIIRERLQTGLDRFERVLTGGKRGADEIEDQIGQFTSDYFRIAKRLNHRYPELQLPTDGSQEELEMFANLLANPGYSLHDAPFEEAARAAATRLRSDEGGEGGTDAQAPIRSDDELRAQWDLFRHFLSLPKLKSALAWAGDVELLKARADVCGIFTSAGKLLSGVPEAEQLKPMRLNAAYMLGSAMVLIDLSVRHSSLGAMLESGLTKLQQYLADRIEATCVNSDG
jgi:hypothetical protein